MKANSVTAQAAQCLTLEWSDQFLEWISGQGIAMFERKLDLGTLDYFHFSSRFTVADGRSVCSFGSHPDRKAAAVKCAAEAVERQAMVQYFQRNEGKFAQCFRNSNGWAVHQTLEAAVEKARSEAIERHLLLHSFFKFGWRGFIEAESIELPTMKIRFFTTRAVNNGIASGLVVAQSAANRGVSFGYCLLSKDDRQCGEAWQSAMFEAVDKLLILNETPQGTESAGWINRETNRFLREPFDLNVFCAPSDSSTIESAIGLLDIETIDLGAENDTDFPLFAALAHGGALIPLFSKDELDRHSEVQLRNILAKHEIFEIPERHPIL